MLDLCYLGKSHKFVLLLLLFFTDSDKSLITFVLFRVICNLTDSCLFFCNLIQFVQIEIAAKSLIDFARLFYQIAQTHLELMLFQKL